jgi:hypothetical protein
MVGLTIPPGDKNRPFKSAPPEGRAKAERVRSLEALSNQGPREMAIVPIPPEAGEGDRTRLMGLFVFPFLMKSITRCDNDQIPITKNQIMTKMPMTEIGE